MQRVLGKMRLKAVTGIVLTALLIGMLTLAFNVQPVKATGISFSDDFEAATIDPFWTVIQEYGTVTLSSDQAHSGFQSVKMSSISGGQRWMILEHIFPTVGKGSLSVWFCDTAPGASTLYAYLSAYNTALPYPSDVHDTGIEDWDPDWYYVAIGGIRTKTSVPRTLGWHEFKLFYNPGDVQIFIDGILVASSPGDHSFDAVRLNVFGPEWRPNAIFYFDDFSVQWIPPPITATVDIDPDTLNLKSEGRWITCYIELPEGYDVTDIDRSTILLEGIVPVDPKWCDIPIESIIGDYDDDDILDLMVKFDRSEVADILSSGDAVELTVTGKLYDGKPFEGTDTITVISKGK